MSSIHQCSKETIKEALASRFNTSSQSKILDNPSLHDVEVNIKCALPSRHLIINETHGGFHHPSSLSSLFTEDMPRRYTSTLQESCSRSHLFFRASATRTPSIEETIAISLAKQRLLQSLTHFFPRASTTIISSIDEVLGHHASIPHEVKIHATAHAFLSCVPATRASSYKFSSSYGAFPRTSFMSSSENLPSPCWMFTAACTWGVQQ
ncbi:UNVERIFIED_CONTAM: hypothetical protein Slati_3429600 [Sesamum latifolium]|uniref:Uncharacterized protein n=1 Tax=Sesamum latifolium TaxID=2727402 RepID=A0AAW2UG68_9LAMI